MELTPAEKRELRKASRTDHISTLPAISRLMRHAGSVKHSKGAVLFTRNIMEEIIKGILGFSLEYTKHANRKIISMSDIKHGYEKMFNEQIYGTGIEKKCKIKAKGKKRGNAESTTKFYMKQDDCLYLASAPFSRFVRQKIKGISDKNMKISSNALTLLHSSIENKIYDIIFDALLLKTYVGKRTILTANDITMCFVIKGIFPIEMFPYLYTKFKPLRK